MNSLAEAKVRDYLVNFYHYDPYECGTVLECMRDLARVAGHELDERFRHLGLAAGPEASIAAAIVDRALGGPGSDTSEYTIRAQIDNWIRLHPAKGRW